MIHNPTVTITDLGTTDTWPVEDITLVGATIDHGGDGLGETPDPSTLSFTLLDPDGIWRKRIGFLTRVDVAVDGTARFAGMVTDMRVTWSDAWVLDVVAVGLKINARTTIMGARPQETAAERIAAAWTYAGMSTYDVDLTGSVTLLPTTESATVSDLTDAAAAADLGYISQRRDGQMWYRGRDTIAASQLVKAVLPAAGVFPASTWVKRIDDLATRVLCGYGTADPQDIVEIVDDYGEITLGRVQARAHSDLYANQADATLIATELLDRLSGRTWRTESLDIDLALPAYSAGRTADVLNLEVGDVVWVTGAPASTPAGDEETYVVLGWSETLGGDSHTFALRVVEYALIRENARWGNVAMSWATAGSTPVGDYQFTPPTLAPGVTP